MFKSLTFLIQFHIIINQVLGQKALRVRPTMYGAQSLGGRMCKNTLHHKQGPNYKFSADGCRHVSYALS